LKIAKHLTAPPVGVQIQIPIAIGVEGKMAALIELGSLSKREVERYKRHGVITATN
jgi:hypothetical protein